MNIYFFMKGPALLTRNKERRFPYLVCKFFYLYKTYSVRILQISKKSAIKIFFSKISIVVVYI
jgi:hypothetical protein